MNQLQERMVSCASTVLMIADQLSKKGSFGTIANQLTRSATSIGANYSEAVSSSSTKDYRNKIKIALKEARETEYWLKLAQTSKPSLGSIKTAMDENIQLIKILTAIHNKTRPS